MNTLSWLMAPALSALGTLILCLNARLIATRVGLLDIPDARKHHSAATPLMGGVALLLTFVPIAGFYAFFVGDETMKPVFMIWLMCVAAMALIGLADDFRSLTPRERLFFSFVMFCAAAILHPAFNVRVLFFEHPPFIIGLGNMVTSLAFTSLCCVGLVNAVNMADGKNGLVLGLALGWLGLLALRAPPEFAPVLSTLAALIIVLLIFNLRGKLFLGDGGAYGLATALGLLSILLANTPGNYARNAIAADDLVLLFLVPIFDSFRLTFSRLRRRQSPMAPDRDHLHHHLMDRFGWPGGLIIYWALALGIGAVGILT